MRRCFSLSSVTLPANAKWIGDSALCKNKSLISIIIPNGVTHIGGNAFGEYINMKSAKLPVTSAFHRYSLLLDESCKCLIGICEGLYGETEVPEGIERIEKCVFEIERDQSNTHRFPSFYRRICVC